MLSVTACLPPALALCSITQKSTAGLVGGRGADGRDLPADAPSEESTNPGPARQDVLDFSVVLSDCIVCLLGLGTVALSLVSAVPIGTDRF